MKNKNKNKNKNQNQKKERVVEKTSSKRLKMKPLTLVIVILLALCLIGLSYYFLGLIFTAIMTVGVSLILLIGGILDHSKTKSKKRKVVKVIMMIILIIGIISLLGAGAFMYYIVKNAPDFKTELLKEKESTVIYDSEGNEYAKLGSEIRENIEYDQISEVFIDALIATEDSRFFQHNGFDLMRFAKAAFGQIINKLFNKSIAAGGGSTLTMQVAKNTFTDAKEDSGIKGLIRKFTDIYISIFQLERNYTKEQIIEFYINNHDLGGTICGIQEASQHFFGKDAKDLNLAEASLLAGLYQAPTSYNPFNHPVAATKRRSTVLYLMVRHGYITSEERAMAESIPVESLLTDSGKAANVYQGYIDLVCKEIKNKLGVDPYTIPMLIYTNMVRSKQDGVNDILNGKTSFKWKDALLQTGIAVLDSTSGKIMAIGAGRNRTSAKSYSYATDINRQIGSTAKPLFDYGPGMEYNNWSTYTLFDDEKGYTYSNGKPISNFDGNWEGIITLRRALSNSRNIPALKAFQQIDNKKILEFVTSVGIKPEISNGYIHEAHAIGSFTGSNPLTMAGAYQIFSNGGYYYEPYAVSKVVFRNNGETVEYSSPKIKVISDSTAYMITDILKGVADYTIKSGLNDILAAKTGTTNVDDATKKAKKLPSSIVRDYWIDGYTHNTVISIWLGYDELSSSNYLNYNTDGKIRKSLLNAVAKACFDHKAVDFVQPKTIVRSAVEKLSDPPMLPSANTPSDQIIYELFKRGTEPTEISTKYLVLDIPTNFNVRYLNNSVKLSWSSVTNLDYVEDGILGYYIYFNNEKYDFTTDTNYTISTLSTYIGEYSVRAGYKDTEVAMGAPATFELTDTKVYNLNISSNETTTYKINDTINNNLYNGGIVRLTANEENVTSQATITITITDKDGNKVTTISNTTANTYTITYNVTYGSFKGTCSNKIVIEEVDS